MAIKNKQFNVRLTQDLWKWLNGFCEDNSLKKTQVVEEYLEALREGRVTIRPRGPDAFPGETVPAGLSADHPILIGVPPEPDPLVNEAFPGSPHD